MNSPHLLIIGGCGGALLLLQLWYLFRLARYWKGWRRALLKQPEAVLVKQYPWHRRVQQQSQLSLKDQSALDREVLIAELDEEIHTDRRWLALQRIGYCAPLLGVILSAVVLWSIVPQTAHSTSTSTPATSSAQTNSTQQNPTQQNSTQPNSAFDSQKLVGIVGTLVLGVGTGAFLALLNQIWSYFAQNWANDLKKGVSEWIDQQPQLQTLVVHPRQASAILKQSVSAVDQLFNTARQHLANANSFTALYREIHAQVGHLRNTFQLLSDQTKTLSTETSLWRAHSQKLRETANAAADSHAKASQTMLEATRQFAGVGEHVAPSLEQFQEFARQLPRLLAGLSDYGTGLAELSGVQRGLVGDYQQAWDQYQQNWNAEVKPAQDAQLEALTAIQNDSAAVRHGLQELNGSLQQLTGEAKSSAKQWHEQSGMLHEAAAQLANEILPALQTTVAANSQSATHWQHLAATSAEGVQLWSDSVQRLRQSVDHQSGALGGALQQQQEVLASSQTALQGVSAQFTELMQAARDSLENSQAAQRELQAASQSLHGSTGQINDFLQSHLQQTHGQLQATVAALQASSHAMQTSSQEQAAKSVNVLQEVQASIRRLSESLASLKPLQEFGPELQNLAVVSRTLANSLQLLQQLPGQIQELIQAQRAKPPAPEKSNGVFKLRNWKFWSN